MRDGHAGKHGGEKHVIAVVQSQRGAGQDCFAAAAPDLETCVHTHAAAVVCLGVDITLIHMGEGVDGCVDDDSSGGGEQIASVKEREGGEDLVRNRAFGAQAGTGQDGDRRDLGAGSAGRRDADDGKRIGDSAAVIQVFDAGVLLADHEGDGLGCVHGGTAADADDEIRAFGETPVAALHDSLYGRILLDLIEDGALHAVIGQGCLYIGDGAVFKGAAFAGDDQGLFSEGRKLLCVGADTVVFTVNFCGHIKKHRVSSSLAVSSKPSDAGDDGLLTRCIYCSRNRVKRTYGTDMPSMPSLRALPVRCLRLASAVRR